MTSPLYSKISPLFSKFMEIHLQKHPLFVGIHGPWLQPKKPCFSMQMQTSIRSTFGLDCRDRGLPPAEQVVSYLTPDSDLDLTPDLDQFGALPPVRNINLWCCVKIFRGKQILVCPSAQGTLQSSEVVKIWSRGVQQTQKLEPLQKSDNRLKREAYYIDPLRPKVETG